MPQCTYHRLMATHYGQPVDGCEDCAPAPAKEPTGWCCPCGVMADLDAGGWRMPCHHHVRPSRWIPLYAIDSETDDAHAAASENAAQENTR